MKCGARVALGVVGGYFLGRTKKMKLALMLGGMAAGKRAGGPGELLSQGSKLLQGNPEIAALTDQVRNRLLDAGKNAVLSVATRQVASLTDRVGKKVESLGDAGGAVGGAAGGAARSATGKAGGIVGRRGGAKDTDDAQESEEPQESEDTAQPDDSAEQADTAEPEGTADEPVEDEAGGDEAGGDEAGGDEAGGDEQDDEQDDEPAPRRRRGTTSTAESTRQSSGRTRSTAKKPGTAAGRTASKATKTPTRAKATASSNGSSRRRTARRSDDA